MGFASGIWKTEAESRGKQVIVTWGGVDWDLEGSGLGV